VLEHLLAVVKGQHRRGAVAAQVVQAHDTPVRVFRQGFGLQQLQRQGQGARGIAGGFERFDAFFQNTPHLSLAGAAAGRQPGVELGAFRGLQVAQQARRAFQIVRNAGGQMQRGRAADEIRTRELAQPEEPLAQGVARGLCRAAGPQQGGQVFTRTGAFQRQPGQQQGVGRGQRVAVAAHANRRCAAQVEARCVVGHGRQDSAGPRALTQTDRCVPPA
jgi:hypothetical protein